MKIIFVFLSIILCTTIFSQTNLSYEIKGIPYVGDSVEVIVRGNHTELIKSLWLIKDNDTQNLVKVDCNSKECILKTKVSLPYEGTVSLRSYLWVFPNSAIKESIKNIEFKCKSEYCEPDPFDWKVHFMDEEKGI